jgi:hypothetical protein
MSREVLLNVSSSAIELAEASATQISPIAIDGPAARSADRRLAVGSAGDDPGRWLARRSSAVAAVCRAMVVTRRRRIVGEGLMVAPRCPVVEGGRGAAFGGRLWVRRAARQVKVLQRKPFGSLQSRLSRLYCAPGPARLSGNGGSRQRWEATRPVRRDDAATVGARLRCQGGLRGEHRGQDADLP